MPIFGKSIVKEFGKPPTRVLHELNFEIQDGEFVSISGRSGSGKSTLLYIMSTLDLPSSGELQIDGQRTSSLSTDQIHDFRAKNVGFIFQFHYLLSELTAIENVLLAPRNLGLQEQYKNDAENLLRKFGLEAKLQSLPAQMSGGEQQRVAIARALIMKPKYIFADEPTGNLDTTNAQVVMDLLQEINRSEGTTVLMVTHDPDFAAMAKREIFLVDGRISKELSRG